MDFQDRAVQLVRNSEFLTMVQFLLYGQERIDLKYKNTRGTSVYEDRVSWYRDVLNLNIPTASGLSNLDMAPEEIAMLTVEQLASIYPFTQYTATIMLVILYLWIRDDCPLVHDFPR